MNTNTTATDRWPTLQFETARGVPFTAVLVYGGDESPTRPVTAPKRAWVEFYDGRYPHTTLGQFVGCYYAGDIIRRRAQPLSLDLSVPNWTIDHSSMGAVAQWLTTVI